MHKKQLLLCLAIPLLALSPLWSQTTDLSSAPNFGFELSLGTVDLPDDPQYPTGDSKTWQKLALAPDLSFGKFGIGLDLAVHFNIVLTPGQERIDFYLPDWVPEAAGKNFFELYLPKIAYLRYGKKGEPLYAKFGSFDNGTLGNGFIMGNYDNTKFLPNQRLFGAALDIDGALFKFPYVGFETFVGNVARLDMFGSRLFVRPIAFLDIPLIKNLQIGGTVAIDREPGLYDDDPLNDAVDPLVLWGVDFRLPILSNGLISLATFGDVAFQPQERWGSMLGVGGRLLSLITYGAQLRVMGPGFIPNYMDASYDLFRSVKYDSMKLAPTGEVFTGWFASAGATLFDDAIIFYLNMDGSFAPPPVNPSVADYPHIRAVLSMSEGFLAGFSISALYEKYYLGAPNAVAGGTGDFWQDLISPENAIIGARVSYKSGPVVLAIQYNLTYDPLTEGFIQTSSITTSVRF